MFLLKARIDLTPGNAFSNLCNFYFQISKFPNLQILIDNAYIKQKLQQQFGESVTGFEEPYGMLSFESPKDMNLKLLQFLYDDPELKFTVFNRSDSCPLSRTLKEENSQLFITCITW